MNSLYEEHADPVNGIPGDFDGGRHLPLNPKAAAHLIEYTTPMKGSGRILAGPDLSAGDLKGSGRFDKVFGNAAFESDETHEPGAILMNNLLNNSGKTRERDDSRISSAKLDRGSPDAIVDAHRNPSILGKGFRKGHAEFPEPPLGDGQSRTPIKAFTARDDIDELPMKSTPSHVAPGPKAVVQTLGAWEVETKQLIAANMREEAVQRYAPSQGMVRCFVRRVKNFLGTHCSFQLHLDNGDVFLLAARRRKKSKASSYVISQDLDDLKRQTPNCISKLKANFVGTEYMLWTRSSDPNSNKDYASQQLCVDFQQSNMLSVGSPRTMFVTSPLPESGWQPSKSDGSDSLSNCLKLAQSKELPPLLEKNLTLLTTKRAEYDESVKGYVLDFKGRVREASVKNFQLVAWNNNTNRQGSDVIMQFGKMGNDLYALDFAYPLSIHLAFSIALASLDTKLCYTMG